MIRHFIATLLACFALSASAVDVNQANRADLETVKGIGPGLSGKILEARKDGNFKNWSDLVDRVGGVGPGNAARFSQAGLTVGGTAFDGSAAKAEKSDKAPKSKEAKETKEPKAAKTSEDGTAASSDKKAKKAEKAAA